MWDLSSLTRKELNLCPLQWKYGVLTTGPQGKSLSPFISSIQEYPHNLLTSQCFFSQSLNNSEKNFSLLILLAPHIYSHSYCTFCLNTAFDSFHLLEIQNIYRQYHISYLSPLFFHLSASLSENQACLFALSTSFSLTFLCYYSCIFSYINTFLIPTSFTIISPLSLLVLLKISHPYLILRTINLYRHP